MPSATARRAAFTLVELLVVIGIIAVLIGLLLPSLTVARQAASKAKCSTLLHSMMLAATVHATDHQGYYPLAGLLPGSAPADLADSGQKHYTYLAQTDLGPMTTLIAPITIALAKEMSFRVGNDTNNQQLGVDESNNLGYGRNFLCPSQASTPAEVLGLNPGILFFCNAAPNTNELLVCYFQPQSYIYNEAVLGWNDNVGRLRGQSTRIRQPALTMFAADGLFGPPNPGGTPSRIDSYQNFYGVGMYTVFNNTTAPVTMGDCFKENGYAGDNSSLDKIRHQKKINIAYCDGHVETRNISFADLSKVYVLAP